MDFSKREYLLKFRQNYGGVRQYRVGDYLWTRLYPKVINSTEYFMCRFEPWSPEYRKPSAECWDHFDEVFSGEFLVPCEYVEFDEEAEVEFKAERQGLIKTLKIKWLESGGT